MSFFSLAFWHFDLWHGHSWRQHFGVSAGCGDAHDWSPYLPGGTGWDLPGDIVWHRVGKSDIWSRNIELRNLKPALVGSCDETNRQRQRCGLFLPKWMGWHCHVKRWRDVWCDLDWFGSSLQVIRHFQSWSPRVTFALLSEFMVIDGHGEVKALMRAVWCITAWSIRQMADVAFLFIGFCAMSSWFCLLRAGALYSLVSKHVPFWRQSCIIPHGTKSEGISPSLFRVPIRLRSIFTWASSAWVWGLSMAIAVLRCLTPKLFPRPPLRFSNLVPFFLCRKDEGCWKRLNTSSIARTFCQKPKKHRGKFW